MLAVRVVVIVMVAETTEVDVEEMVVVLGVTVAVFVTVGVLRSRHLQARETCAQAKFWAAPLGAVLQRALRSSRARLMNVGQTIVVVFLSMFS